MRVLRDSISDLAAQIRAMELLLRPTHGLTLDQKRFGCAMWPNR